MRRWCIGLFIGTYLSALGLGIVSHALSVGTGSHPIMYFLVWDMYCGWGAYDYKYRAIAEGVSGTFYDVEPAPWGTFKPFNTRDRYQYSMSTGWMAKAAAHTVSLTEHEPIARMFVVEENWAKQFNLPDYVWKARYNIPKQPHNYTKIRVEMDGTGEIVNHYPSWVEVQGQMMVSDNPRIMQDVRNSRSFWVVDEHQSGGNRYFQGKQPENFTSFSNISAPSAN